MWIFVPDAERTGQAPRRRVTWIVAGTEASTLRIAREAMQLVRWEYDIDVSDGDLGFVPAEACVQIHPPPDQWEIDHRGFAGLYSYVTRKPALLAEGVDAQAMRASIVRFSLVGIVLYLATLVVALFSAPLCLLAHLLIAVYYCFEQIRSNA